MFSYGPEMGTDIVEAQMLQSFVAMVCAELHSLILYVSHAYRAGWCRACARSRHVLRVRFIDRSGGSITFPALKKEDAAIGMEQLRWPRLAPT